MAQWTVLSRQPEQTALYPRGTFNTRKEAFECAQQLLAKEQHLGSWAATFYLLFLGDLTQVQYNTCPICAATMVDGECVDWPYHNQIGLDYL